MGRIAYFRSSSASQSIEAQRKAMGGGFDREFVDEGVSGATAAADRAAFRELLKYVRDGDRLHVFAVDRLGRDAIDVQTTVRTLLDRGVTIEIRGLGQISRGAGELILAVLAQVADMERLRIKERCDSGRAAAKAALKETGKTHRGKVSLGRPFSADRQQVAVWRRENGASIGATAKHFAISTATVKRYCSTR